MHRAVREYARVLEHQISTCWSNRHEDASALQNLRVGFLVLEDLDVDFSSCPENQWNESILTMSKRIKDVVESMAAQSRRLVADEEGEAQRSMRYFAWQLALLGKVFDAVVSGARTNEDQHPPQTHSLEMSWGYMYVFKGGHDLGARPRRRPACDRSCQLFNPPVGCEFFERSSLGILLRGTLAV